MAEHAELALIVGHAHGMGVGDRLARLARVARLTCDAPVVQREIVRHIHAGRNLKPSLMAPSQQDATLLIGGRRGLSKAIAGHGQNQARRNRWGFPDHWPLTPSADRAGELSRLVCPLDLHRS